MRYPLITAAGLAAVFLVSSAPTFAQVEVVESSPTIRPIGQPRNAPATPVDESGGGSMQADIYFQLQTLQQEVANLRGLVEEQAYELKRLKQQRLDDYVDLDRRISDLSGGSKPAASATPVANSTPANPPATASTPAQPRTPAPSADEFETYNAAMDQIRAKQYDKAIEAFNSYLSTFPNGQYAGNSFHWLGQLHQIRNEGEQAKKAYQTVVDSYPSHAKAQDAKLKLGQLLFQQGDKAQSKKLLQEVASSGADEARLAKNFLQQNFPQ
ncbi:tol-pal system protein YbgF [Aurantivibrio plasticivorans]